MAKKPIIMLQGGSLFMDCIANRLQNSFALEIKQDVEKKSQPKSEDVDIPAAVLFDFDQLGLGSLFSYLTSKQRPLVFGLSVTQNTVMLLYSELRTVSNIAELQKLIVKELTLQARKAEKVIILHSGEENPPLEEAQDRNLHSIIT